MVRGGNLGKGWPDWFRVKGRNADSTSDTYKKPNISVVQPLWTTKLLSSIKSNS